MNAPTETLPSIEPASTVPPPPKLARIADVSNHPHAQWTEQEDDTVDLILEWHRAGNRSAIARRIPDIEEALAMVKPRFGCAYQALPPHLQVEREILVEAAARSGGHQLRFAPEDARHTIETLDFLKEIIERGANRRVILRYFPDLQSTIESISETADEAVQEEKLPAKAT